MKPAWLKRVRWNAWLFAVSVALLGWFLHEFAFGSGLVNLSYDLLHILRQNKIPANEAVIVYLDEKSYLDLKQPQNKPWDRALYAAKHLGRDRVHVWTPDLVKTIEVPARISAETARCASRRVAGSS